MKLVLAIMSLLIGVNAQAAERVYEENVWGICGAASPISYQASWNEIQSPTLQICEGSVTLSATLLSCSKLINGQFSEVVLNTFCASIIAPEETFQSPAGSIDLTDPEYIVQNGRYEKTCALGSSTGSISSLLCNEGYSTAGNICEKLEVITAEYVSVENTSGLSATGTGVAATGTPVTLVANNIASVIELIGSATTGSGISSTYQATPPISLLSNVLFSGNTSSPVSSLSYSLTPPSESPLTGTAAVSNSLFSIPILKSAISNLANLQSWIVDLIYSGSAITPPQYSVNKYVITQISNLRSGSDLVSTSIAYNNSLYFDGTAVNGKLHKYNPQTNQITEISNIRTGGSDSIGASMVVYNGDLYFSAVNSSTRTKLYRYNEQTNSITQISNLYNGNNDSPQQLTVFDGDLYFTAQAAGNFVKVYKYNSGTNQITQVTNLRNGASDGPRYLTVYNNELYFTAFVSVAATKLFKYNPTANQLTQVSNIRLSAATDDNIANLTVHDSHLYISSNTANGGKLLRYTAQTNEFVQISNISDGTSDIISGTKVYNDEIYFSATVDSISKLYKYSPQTNQIIQLSDISAGYDQPQNLTVYKDELYFSAYSANNTSRLYKYSSKSNKVTQVTEFKPSGIENVTNLTIVGDSLYFKAGNAASQDKLYRLKKE